MHPTSGPSPRSDEIPTGIENLLALAAVNEAFATALLRDPEEAARASGVDLSDGERAILEVSTPEALGQLAEVVRERLPKPERRRFLELATAAVATLAAGGAVTLSRELSGGPVVLADVSRTALAFISPPTGSRPDRPSTPRPRPSRPRPRPSETSPIMDIQPDQSAPVKTKPKQKSSGCNR